MTKDGEPREKPAPKTIKVHDLSVPMVGSSSTTTPSQAPAARAGASEGAQAPAPANIEALPEPEIIDEVVKSKRLRRPWDLFRVLIALVSIGLLLALGYFAARTTAGLTKDLESATTKLPDIAEFAIDLIGILGILVIPVGTTIQLLMRGRRRQLLDAFIALLAATILLTIAAVMIDAIATPRFDAILAETAAEQPTPLVPILGGLMAFITTARLMTRTVWATASTLVILAVSAMTVIAGGPTIVGILVSLIFGWGVGLAVRYIFGTPSTRPKGAQVAKALAGAGLPVTRLEGREATEEGRLYAATQPDGRELQVFVLDRDLEGAGLGRAVWSYLRLRDSGRSIYNMRQSMNHRTLMAFAAQVRDVPAARLLAAVEISPDSSLLAYERIAGKRLDEMAADDVTDEILDQAWAAVAALRRSDTAHRRLSAHNIGITDSGTVKLLGIGHGDIAAGDIALRIDVAELLCTQAMIVGKERAIASAQRILGNEVLLTCMPALQPVALSRSTRKALKSHKPLLGELRDSLIEENPDAEIEQIELERVKPRTIILAFVGVIAGYFVVLQVTHMLSGVNLGEILTTANWWWVLAGLGASLMTYPGAAWSLSGFVPEKLRLFPTTLTQLAGDFITLITPPTLGAVAINLRYLQKQGIHPALATASIGVSQVGAFGVHTLLLLAFGIAAGSQQDFSLHVPTFVFFLLGGVLIISAALLALQPTRRLLWKRVGPLLKQVGPRLLTVAQTPMKLLEGFGGMLVLNLGYIVCLAACVHAFDGDVSFAAIAIVYLTGSVIGQAAPTPGGLGAVEVAMSAGLTAAGVPAGIALTSVLVYRMLTFILPTVPGWFAFNWLQKHDYI